MKTKDKCGFCGKEHRMMITPGEYDLVHCPYDSSGKSVMPGMDGAISVMRVNQFGVLCYGKPARNQEEFDYYFRG